MIVRMMDSLPVALLVLRFLAIQISKAQEEFLCCHGDVKLLDGNTLNEGRVEVCLSGQWKTVCDNSWSDSDTQVVCKQLGYSRQGAVLLTQTSQGQRPWSSAIVECKGTENRVLDCNIRNAPDGQCSHSGVQCSCRNSDLRLEGGTAQSSSGRVEMCVDNVWVRVCGDSWTELNARVVCKQLGFPLFGARPATYGLGSGPVHINDIRCTGAESSLVNCSHSTQHNVICNHSSDAGVQCQASPPCHDGEVRLVNGTYPHEGRVEVCFNETWGKICDYINIYGWNRTEAEVVCKQLGYTGANFSTHSFGKGSVPVTILNPQCRGTESSLAECVYTNSQNICSRTEHGIIGIQCIQDTAKNGKLRLTDGLTRYEGRVEMYWNSEWRTICSDGWDESDTKVVCRQLNYLSTAIEVKEITYGQGYRRTTMLLANVGCTGSEGNLTNCCATRISDNSQCHSRVHAGVRCAQCVENSIQLVGELSGNEGFVAICLGGSWGKVCGGNAQAAQVVCRQLGFSITDPVVYHYQCFFDVVSALPFLITNVQCTSNETQLTQCSYEYRGIAFCNHIVGIKCELTEQNIPGAPVNAQISSVTSSTVGLTWSPPLVSETLGLAIYSYVVTCSTGPQQHDATVKATDGHNVMISQLHPSTHYNCCVSVNSENGRGKVACLSVITASSGGVDYPASSTALTIFFVMVTIALIAALTVLIYLHHKRCIPFVKMIIKIGKQLKKPARDDKHPTETLAHDVENSAYEFVDTTLGNNPESTLENLPYQVTVLSEMENTCSVSPVEYLTPTNTELITCDLCIEHGNPTGICTHRGSSARNSYQSLILTQSGCPTAYQELVQESLTKRSMKAEPGTAGSKIK